MTALLERTGSVVSTSAFEQLTAGLVPHSYASHDDVASMRDVLTARVGLHTGANHFGDLWYLGLSPGTVTLRSRTVNSLDALPEDLQDGPQLRGLDGTTVDGVTIQDFPEWAADLDVEPGRTRGAITEWSRGSRRRMVRRIAELDFSAWSQDGGNLAMVTLTLPGEWQMVAPTGQVWKRLIDVLRKRWLREVGTPWRGLWKMEFQGRGAPHQHMLMRVPVFALTRDPDDPDKRELFQRWLSRAWADICRAAVYARSDGDGLAYESMGEYDRHLVAGTSIDFSGKKFSDPRRTAIYFLKHSTKTTDGKEYQHVVPEEWRTAGSVGRFWGVWGLHGAHLELEVDRHGFHVARRILRRLSAASSARAELQRRRAVGESVWTMSKARRRAGFGARGGGWYLANDGLALAYDLGRALAAASAAGTAPGQPSRSSRT